MRPTGYPFGMRSERSAPRLARWGWATVAVTLLVILWGAWVRASGSGAGCGNHWPLCNGEVVPLSPSIETLTEYTHRLSSGIALLMVIALVVGAWRSFPARHRVRRAAWTSLLLIVIEALIGAGLVKFELVADNASMQRALTLGAHLVNTQLLLAALALTAWWAGGRGWITLDAVGRRGWWLALGSVALLVVGLTGAVASLGDTLFPARTLREGIAQDFDPTSHLLLRLRVLHPFVALATGMLAAWIGLTAWEWPGMGARVRAPGRLVAGVVLLQWTIGLVSLLLLVPVALLLAHLLVADLLWLAWVVFAVTILEDPSPDSSSIGPPSPVLRPRSSVLGRSVLRCSVLRRSILGRAVLRHPAGANRTIAATPLAASRSNTDPPPSSR